jgi:hypothetical protein
MEACYITGAGLIILSEKGLQTEGAECFRFAMDLTPEKAE